jgi:acetyl esterase/lipase
MFRRYLLAAAAALALASPGSAQQNFTRTDDVIYGRKYGLALTMDVLAPKENANGRGIIFCVSGGWVSNKPGANITGFVQEFLNRGYTVFAVVHGSQPKFTIPEVLEDMHRAVRFIKANAKKYNIDPDKLGIAGGSAGGHLSLMQGTAPLEGDPKAIDPVLRQSSRVAAVACFYPPTDFLNYGKSGNVALGGGTLKNFRPPFDFWERDKETNKLVVIEDEERRKAIGKTISPVYHVSKDSAPSLIIHGDADTLVPIQQAELIITKFKEAGVPCELVVKKGGGTAGRGRTRTSRRWPTGSTSICSTRSDTGWARDTTAGLLALSPCGRGQLGTRQRTEWVRGSPSEASEAPPSPGSLGSASRTTLSREGRGRRDAGRDPGPI